uniref:Uncharacterized protein n=1 Tax=Streptomyces sp. NBC_00008 TaxID=2903610 RepID=A0AAU2VJQ3_9ACTN
MSDPFKKAVAVVLYCLRRRPHLGDADFERDAGMVAADLNRLRELMESA